jgi:hypothetical protein
MSDMLTEEEAKEALPQAAELAQKLFAVLQGSKRSTALVALEMLLPVVALGMGLPLEKLMLTLAHNVPTFYRKWLLEEQPQEAPVFDLSEFRKSKEGP